MSLVVRLSSCPHRTLLHSPSAMARHALRTHEFKVLLRLLQQDPAVRVGSHRDLRRFLHGVHYLLRTGIPWRDLPPRFGHWNSLFRRYRRWCLAGVWERLAAACAEGTGATVPGAPGHHACALPPGLRRCSA